MRIYYSNKGFYPEAFKNDYVASGKWPKKAVEITAEQHLIYSGVNPEGKTLGTDSNGFPCWDDIPDKTNEEMLSIAISTLSTEYKKDISDLNTAYLAAIVSDGPSEITKQQMVRNQISERKLKYAADVSAEKEKYPT